MKVICSYCKKNMGEKPPLESTKITHGMCESCLEYYMNLWFGLPLDIYLDRYNTPVLVVNEDTRIIAANQLMKEKLGKSGPEIFGLLGGEVMECRYSKSENGCGKTEHCTACVIRKTVVKTLETGEASHNVPAYLNRENDRLELRISTEKIDDIVTISLTDMKSTVFVDDESVLTGR